MALAKERNVNAARGVHDIHADFSADPYGQPNVAPDNPTGAPDPGAQMSPDVALAHHIADLAQKHAAIQKTQADTALAAAKASQVPVQNDATAAGTFHTLHQAANTAVQTNRLARTPIPQPAAPTGP
jgi:hypothetical protein